MTTGADEQQLKRREQQRDRQRVHRERRRKRLRPFTTWRNPDLVAEALLEGGFIQWDDAENFDALLAAWDRMLDRILDDFSNDA